jgi:hypothetical protein
MHPVRRITRLLAPARVAMVLALVAIAACGGSESTKVTDPPPPPPPPPPQAVSLAVTDGNNQTADVGEMVAVSPSIVARDNAGRGVSGVGVIFEVVSGGGTLTGAQATTDAGGVARVGSWRLGTAGENVLRARLVGSAIAPVDFRATGRERPQPQLREWTVLVYLAADNSLAVEGVQDLDEMESALADDRVAVVTEAEFSPDQLQRAGCTTPACINRPNFNTFRYAVRGGGNRRVGVDGTVTDIGNRDMTRSDELREFIQWGKQNFPAKRYALVLWNHGGGYTGLIEDVTSAGSRLMSLDDVRTALTGAGGVDVVDFDMCLMGGYETLAKLQGVTKYVTFSEAIVPGAGNPYKDILDALRADPTADARATSLLFADLFTRSYMGNRASTTMSVYDMAGYAAFEQALGNFAEALRLASPAYGQSIAAAAASTQKFDYPFLTDIGDLLDKLEGRVDDASLQLRIRQLRAAATANTFRLRSTARSGADQSALRVDRATGLHILLPSGAAAERLPATGPASFGAYQSLYQDKPWTRFLGEWLAGAGTRVLADQGENRFESYLVWSARAIEAEADVEFWILEPDGKIYIPFLGTVTPNGRFTADSYEEATNYEGYLTNRYVQVGTYKIYASLYTDPANVKPDYNLAYRFGQTTDYKWYLKDALPLSKDRSWLDDANATIDKVDAGAYTDLRPVVGLTVGPASSGSVIAGGLAGAPALTAVAPSLAASAGAPRLTSAQLGTLRRALAERHAQRLRAGASGRRTPRAAFPLPFPGGGR